MSRPGFLLIVGAAFVMPCVSGVQAQVVMETVTIGNPGNTPDDEVMVDGTTGYGGVAYLYDMGKFEVTAGQYVEFLNAVAATDPYGLYNPGMDSDPQGCQITQNGVSGSFTYDFSGGAVEAPGSTAADWENRPVNYVSWGDAARFCNWLHNGQPTGVQDLTTTEDGSYYLNGATSDAELLAVVREPGATWVIPSEDEWYKVAYHYNDGVTGDYYDFPTSSDIMPGYIGDGESIPDPDPGNYATFDGDFGIEGIGPPYYRTEVGEHENSMSPYGTFDQGGNIWEWTEAVKENGSRCVRGGCFPYDGANLRSRIRSGANSSGELNMLGFRIARAPEAVPAVSEWGLLVMALLGLAAGTIMFRQARRRGIRA